VTLAAYVLSLILANFPPGVRPAIETREAGAERLATWSRAHADSAHEFGARWPEGEQDLARAGVAFWGVSMGFRREVQTGELRGPANASCFADMLPSTIRHFAQFETAGLSDAELMARVVGLDYFAARRCADAGFAALVHAREYAEKRCRTGNPTLAAFAIYASGTCSSKGSITVRGKQRPRTWMEQTRFDLLVKLRARKSVALPAWYREADAEGAWLS
jgi:hypothetical protein